MTRNENTTMPPAPSQQLLRNRVFHCKMRNKHYERAFMQFRKIQGQLRNTPHASEAEHLKPLKEFLEHLSICLEYAESAVFPGKRERIHPFSEDRVHGILREEIILAHFVRELVSIVRYIIDRIDTDTQLQQLGKELEGVKQHGNARDRSGFVDGVLHSLAALQQTSSEEFETIYGTINLRYEIGNKLFSLIRELQKF